MRRVKLVVVGLSLIIDCLRWHDACFHTGHAFLSSISKPRQQCVSNRPATYQILQVTWMQAQQKVRSCICSVPFSASDNGSRRQLQAEAALHIAAGQGMLLTPSMIGRCSESSRNATAALRAELSF